MFCSVKNGAAGVLIVVNILRENTLSVTKIELQTSLVKVKKQDRILLVSGETLYALYSVFITNNLESFLKTGLGGSLEEAGWLEEPTSL